MARLFDIVPGITRRGNRFNLSYDNKLTFRMGELIPMLLYDVNPGEKFSISSEVFVRLMPLLAPLMHMMDVTVHFFYCANRILWTSSDDDGDIEMGWRAFIFGGEDGDKDPTFPSLIPNAAAQVAKSTLADYLGLPTGEGDVTHYPAINVLPFRMYVKVWNEYYRDANLQDALYEYKTETTSVYEFGSTSMGFPVNYKPLYRAYSKDYFTSALPWVQRAGAEVDIPLSGSITFVPDYSNPALAAEIGAPTDLQSDAVTGEIKLAGGNSTAIYNLSASKDYDVDFDGLTIEELRTAVRLQEFLERSARGGGRYVERTLVHFGIKVPDAGFRPVYIGGGKAPFSVNMVNATADSGSYDVGDMLGNGYALGRTNRAKFTVPEHGWIMGIMSVIPRNGYFQGLPKMFSRFDRYDYLWPEFGQLGEEPIYQREIFIDGSVDDEADVFGYQSRYASYKYRASEVHGEFKDTLKYWHLAREFASAPALNGAFIQCNPVSSNVHRCFMDTSTANPKLLAYIYNNVKAIRPLPFFGVPRL